MSSEIDRRLTTILCADVAGYSRLMNIDEERTLARLKETRDIFLDHIGRHGGRVINMTGDGLLGEFPSVVRAVECAVEVQNILNRESRTQPPAKRMLYRIGINVGDIMVDKDDIFGDGVNVAARLEAMAPVGGICISGSVFEQVKHHLPREFRFLGNREVKNIADPIPVYSLILSEAPATAAAEAPRAEASFDEAEDTQFHAKAAQQARFYHRAMMYGGIILLLFIINLSTSTDYWWFLWPTGALAFVLLMNAIRVFGKGHYSRDWHERRVRDMKARKRPDGR